MSRVAQIRRVFSSASPETAIWCLQIIIIVLVNGPLALLLIKYWGDGQLFALMGHAPGQFLFLAVMFPFIAVSAAKAIILLRRFLIKHQLPQLRLLKKYFLSIWALYLAGICFGVLVAWADSVLTPDDYYKFEKPFSLWGIQANAEVIKFLDSKDNAEGIRDSWFEEFESKYAHNPTTNASNDLQSDTDGSEVTGSEDAPELVDIYGPFADFAKNKQLKTWDEDELKEFNISGQSANKISYLLTYAELYNRSPFLDDIHKDKHVHEDSVIVLLDSIELAAGITCAWVVFICIVTIFLIRYKSQLRATLPKELREIASWLIIVLAFSAFYPVLRQYTISEISRLFPEQYSGLPAPLMFGILIVGSGFYLALAFARDSGFVKTVKDFWPFVLSVITFIFSRANPQYFRTFLGSECKAANLGLLLILYVALVAPWFYVVWTQSSNASAGQTPQASNGGSSTAKKSD